MRTILRGLRWLKPYIYYDIFTCIDKLIDRMIYIRNFSFSKIIKENFILAKQNILAYAFS